MHITDAIADMLTRIRNANAAKHDTVDVIRAEKSTHGILHCFTEDWETAKTRIDKVIANGNLDTFESYIEAANILKINDDILCNIGSVDQYKGYLQIKEIIKRYYPKVRIYPIYMADNHIDGTLIPLTEGVFLANERFLKTDYIKNNELYISDGKTLEATVSALLGDFIRKNDTRIGRLKEGRTYFYYLTKNQLENKIDLPNANIEKIKHLRYAYRRCFIFER